MASVNYKKCKSGSGEAGALIRHCDKEERIKREHNNEHIDKGLTDGNRQGGKNYDQTMAALRNRLAELDAMPGANKRKDRVECFMLEVPIPHGYDPREFTKIAVREISEMYGTRNVLNWYLHVDEVHEYVDHGNVKESLSHIHVPVVPEIDGKLNGKAFSSRANMVELNNRIHESVRHELGGPGLLTGEKARKKSVEELKIESYKDLQARSEELDRGIAKKVFQEYDAEVSAERARKEALTAQKSAERARNELEAVNTSLSQQKELLKSIKSFLVKVENITHVIQPGMVDQVRALMRQGAELQRQLDHIDIDR